MPWSGSESVPMELSNPADALSHGDCTARFDRLLSTCHRVASPTASGSDPSRAPDRQTLRPRRPTVPADSPPAVGGANVQEPPVTLSRSFNSRCGPIGEPAPSGARLTHPVRDHRGP